ncbi:hypothetical protein [Oricola sp.]|uniref:hypothetical protein n=1 Tax=Oricola sp. TaxID=1979950 RepID=UPI0025E3EE67|nr:hypothetical protein [Oricola sp.]MCI5074098.1 hypothetical protein [Oricola sp.]
MSHSVSAEVGVAAEAAFRFLCDPLALGAWSLGCMNTRPDETGNGIYIGRSLFDGSQTRFSISADTERLTIDYLLGNPGAMVPRISTRVVPAKICELDAGQCCVTMTAWRPRSMDDARWHQLCACHEAEILLIRAQCEAAHAGRPVRPFAAE